MGDVVILSGARTPFGRLSGAFASLSAADLGGVAIEAALDRGNVAPTDVMPEPDCATATRASWIR